MSELNRKEALAQLVAELDRVYPQGSYDSTALQHERGMPDFVTARNGHIREFTSTGKHALRALIYAWNKEAPKLAIRVDATALESLLRQNVADLHADSLFGEDASTNLQLLDETVTRMLNEIPTDFTHSFPAMTLNMEFAEPFVIGPVAIMRREHWLEIVDFSERAKNEYPGDDPSSNRQWKTALLHALALPKKVTPDEPPLPALAAHMYSPLSTARSLLRLSLSGYERSLSIKAARHICKTALDGLSLALGGKDLFHAQTLADERMQPVDHHTLIEANGFLFLPGYGLNKQVSGISGQKAKEALCSDETQPILNALSHILDSLVSPASHPHPLLAMRWAMALDWLAEGTRETSEAIALAKIGTSLDVLSEGGKFGGILNMLTHLTGWKEETEFMVGSNPRTLRWLLKEIYDHGRSKILHGNIFDRLKTFAEIRSVSESFARIALIESALRLHHYTGKDSPKAFRDIPKSTSVLTLSDID